MDMTRSKALTILFSIILMGILLHLVRKKRLKEEYALLWIAMSLVGIALASWRALLDGFAGLLGIASPPNAFFLVSLLFLIGILIHFSVAVSTAMERTRVLAQEFALLQWEKDQLERRLAGMENALRPES